MPRSNLQLIVLAIMLVACLICANWIISSKENSLRSWVVVEGVSEADLVVLEDVSRLSVDEQVDYYLEQASGIYAARNR